MNRFFVKSTNLIVIATGTKAVLSILMENTTFMVAKKRKYIILIRYSLYTNNTYVKYIYSFANTNITQYTDPYTNETFTGFFLDDDYYNYTTIGYYQMATYTESIIGANVRYQTKDMFDNSLTVYNRLGKP